MAKRRPKRLDPTDKFVLNNTLKKEDFLKCFRGWEYLDTDVQDAIGDYLFKLRQDYVSISINPKADHKKVEKMELYRMRTLAIMRLTGLEVIELDV